jgi:hypothetical protein
MGPAAIVDWKLELVNRLLFGARDLATGDF